MNKLASISALTIATLLGGVIQANAASINFAMEYSSHPGLLPDGNEYVSVMISDGQNGDIDFQVGTLGGVPSKPGSGSPEIRSFGFNLGDSGATIYDVVSHDDWWVTSGLSLPVKDSGPKPFGDFDVKLFSTAKGGPVNHLLFSIKGVDGDTVYDYASSLSTGNASRFNTLFSAGIGSLKACPFQNADGSGDISKGGCIDQATFGGPINVVPVPAAAWLFGSALAGLGWMRRRKTVGPTEGLKGL